MDTTTVRVRVTSPSGEPVQGAYVRAALESVGVDLDGYVDRGEVTANTDAQGLATLELWPNTEGNTGAEYRIVARGSDGRKLIDESVSVPQSAVDVWLHDIVKLPAPTAKPYDEASIAVIQQDRILAQSARDAAQQSETNASGSAAQASNSATAAGNSETNATGSAAAAANSATAASTAETNAQQHAADAETAKTGAETARAGAETAQGAAETARDDALSIYGDALTQQQAVTDAQTAAGTATTKATEAGNSATAAAGSASTATTKATEAGTARDQAQAAAVTATDKAGAASLDADAAVTAKTAAEAANTAAQQAKTDTQALASQVTVDAAATLDRSADLISHANSTYSYVSAERQASEQAVAQAIALYGSAQALDDAVQETYANRAIINTQIATNMIVLRA